MVALTGIRSGLALVLLASGAVIAEDCPDFNPHNNLYWGDLHVHTRYSLDASTQDTRTTPAQAYAFARGEGIGIQPWENGKPLRRLQLERPLDFAAVTDHAELLGEVELCTREGSPAYDSLWCKGFRGFPRTAFFMFNTAAASGRRLGICGDAGQRCLDAASDVWGVMQAAANEAYEACEFTSFNAYEWTGASENLANIHRNVIFSGAQVPALPPSFLEAGSAEALYSQLQADCLEGIEGCDVQVIPHNSNLSDGFMFPVGEIGTPVDADTRRRFETLVEVLQHKGSSECYYSPGVTEDELCAFEQLPYDKFSGKFQTWTLQPPQADDGFLRAVLNDGLDVRAQLGSNPFEFGFIGSTDTHLGTPGAVAEVDFAGHGGAGAPAGDGLPQGLVDDLEYSPGGLAAVWAPQNRREDIFDAMRRRETYATSGPRIELRLFAGETLPGDLCEQVDFAAAGYAAGEPMGSVIRGAAQARIAVAAQRDALSLPLQRLQVIKGWLDDKGEHHQRVYDIAGNADSDAGVNLTTCEPHGEGANQLCDVWADPDFSPTQQAYYYARAVENPSCRWSQRICAAAGVDCARPDTVPDDLEACCSDTHRPVIHERAVSSPVWYYPVLSESPE